MSALWQFVVVFIIVVFKFYICLWSCAWFQATRIDWFVSLSSHLYDEVEHVPFVEVSLLFLQLWYEWEVHDLDASHIPSVTTIGESSLIESFLTVFSMEEWCEVFEE